MKNIIKLTIAFTLLFSFSSCEKIDELTDVKFNSTITQHLSLNIGNTAGEPELFNEQLIIKLTEADGDLADYLNYLKDIEVKKLNYKITDFSGDEEGIITANFTIGGTTLFSHTDMNVKAAADSGEIFNVDDISDLSSIASSLLSSKQISTSFTGQATTNSPMNFKIVITLELGITADPI